MVKLAILAAVLAAFIFVANVSAYRTTVTTVEIEDGEVVNKGKESEQQRCLEQLQRVQLNPCETFVRRKVQEDGLSLRGIDNRDEQQHCCQQFQRIPDRQCQCQALQQIAERLQGRFQDHQQKQRLERELKNLPERCGLQSIRQCDIRTRTDS